MFTFDAVQQIAEDRRRRLLADAERSRSRHAGTAPTSLRPVTGSSYPSHRLFRLPAGLLHRS